MTPVTFAPIMAVIAVTPVPVPVFVMLPVLLIEVPDNVTPLAMELLLFSVRFPVPMAPPDKVSNAAPLLLLFVRVVPPELTVSAPLTVNPEAALFSVMAVTLVPTAELIVVPPEPVPELVIEPILFTATVVRLVPPAVALLLFSMRFPVPVTPPDNTNVFVALVFVSVVPPELTFNAPLILNAEVALLSSMLETLLPTLVLMSELPAPVPELVIDPELLTELVDNVIAPAVAPLLFRTRLPEPLTPPVSVNDAMLPAVMVVPLALVVSNPLIVMAELELF